MTHAAVQLPRQSVPGHPQSCKCEGCREAKRVYAYRRYQLQALGRWQPFSDAGAARAHVQALMAAGIGSARVARLAGVPPSTVSHLLYGSPRRGIPPSTRLRTESAARLLAVRAVPQNLAGRRYVDAAGTRRRLQALATQGHPVRAVARILGADESSLGEISRGRGSVTAGLARGVATVYDRLWDQPPPEGTKGERIAAVKTRRHAERQGWAPPLAWDDDTLDDPAAEPAQGWRRTHINRAADLAAEAAELTAQGYTRAQAAERIGISRAALDKALARSARRAAGYTGAEAA